MLPIRVKQLLKDILTPIYHGVFSLIPVNQKLIVFDSLNAKGYMGSPKAVYEYMVEQGFDKEYRMIWFFDKGRRPESIPGNAEMKSYKTLEYYYYMARAKMWIFDSRNPNFLLKRSNQKYIQIWHGTPYKTLGLDIEKLNLAGGEVGKKQFYKDVVDNSKQWDYLVSQNDFSTQIFRRCFAFEKEMLLTGYPRNDVLFKKNNPEDIKKIKEQLGLPLDKKVILYAPTYRDNQYDNNKDYTFKNEVDYELLQKELSDEYVMIVKYHYLVGNKIDLSKYKDFVYVLDSNEEISTLYLVADKLITDYSSVMFDYGLLHRPMYFFCYDLEEYATELRGCYFDLVEEVPGPISKTTEDLINDLKMSDTEFEKKYHDKQEAFYKKYHTYENGTASKQIAELAIRLLNEK